MNRVECVNKCEEVKHFHSINKINKRMWNYILSSFFRRVAGPHRRLCGVCTANHYSRQAQKCIIATFLLEREVASLSIQTFLYKNKKYLNRKQRKFQETLKMWVCVSAVQCRAEHAASGTSWSASCAPPPGGDSDAEERANGAIWFCVAPPLRRLRQRFHSPVFTRLLNPPGIRWKWWTFLEVCVRQPLLF